MFYIINHIDVINYIQLIALGPFYVDVTIPMTMRRSVSTDQFTRVY